MHRRRGQRPVCGGASGASQSWWKELRCFVARSVAEGQATLLGKTAVKEPWTPNAPSTTKQSMCFCDLQLAMTRCFFFCDAQKGVLCYERGKRWGCGLRSVDACTWMVWSLTEGLQLMLSVTSCMDQRVAVPKCLWQMPVALQSEAAPRFVKWVQTKRT